MKVLDDPARSTPPAPSLPLDREWGRDSELDIAGGVLFLWHSRYLILGVTLLGALLGFVATRFMPAEYTGITTIFVNVPRTQNPLAPDALSVEALDRLAGSALLRSQVDAELTRRGLVDDHRRVFDFRTVLYKSTEPQKPYLPLLGLSAVASSPDLARDAANVWASVLLDEARRLTAATRASAVDFIVSEYPRAAERLSGQERSLEALKRRHAAALQKVKNAAAVSLKEEQLWSREQLVINLEEERDRLALDITAAEAAVSALERELAGVPATVAAAGGQLNPVHGELTQRLAEARVRRSELSARRGALDRQIQQTRRDAMNVRTALGASELSIAGLEGEQGLELAAREREVESARANFKKLEEQIGDAHIVKADNESSLTPGAPAETPAAPSGPDTSRTIALAALAAFGLSVAAAWLLDRTRRAA